MTEDEVRTALRSAIDGIRGETPPLNFQVAHERSIAHRLAVHMEPHFGQPHDWNVDCEYDRDGQLKKTLQGVKGCDSQKKTDEILPDIIVHHRGGKGREHNLLVIEIKKAAKQDPCDRRKLELLTTSRGYYQYQLGLYINVDEGNFACTWYRNGERIE
jgi:hypothetical protein